MLRRLKQILLPSLIALVIATMVSLGLVFGLKHQFQADSRQETAGLIGVIMEQYPDADPAALMKALQGGADVDTLSRGNEILRRYGVYAEDYADRSSEIFAQKILWLLVIVLLAITVTLTSYFWLLDWRQEQRIVELVHYLQRLKDRIYELKLDENTEEKFSLLTNEIYKIVVLLKEASEHNRAERQRLETALADISHQLRTPLTSLQVMVDNIYDDPDMPPEIRQDFLRTMSHQVEDMSELVTTLLNLAKFDNATIKLHDRPIVIQEVLQKIRENLEVLADLNDVTLEFAGDLNAKINFDPRWQTEALTNIVKNCIEHSHAGGKVMVAVEENSLFTKIMIEDQGEGISKHDLRHIFERFYKARNSKSGSIGIGLSFAKTVIEADHGQISVRSAEGVGTKFTVTYFR